MRIGGVEGERPGYNRRDENWRMRKENPNQSTRMIRSLETSEEKTEDKEEGASEMNQSADSENS